MKKILFYLPFIKLGGIEQVSIEYLNGLISKGYQVDLIIDFDMGKDGNTFEHAIPKEINYQFIKSNKISKLIYLFRTLGKKNKIFNIILYTLMIIIDFYYYHTKVKKIVKNEKYDWTISFYQFLPSYITTIKSSKHILWLHGSIEHFFGGIKNLFKKNYQKKLNKYDYVITIADEMKEQLIDFYPNLLKNKIKRIYNPFDFKKVINKSNDIKSLTIDENSLLKDKYICMVSRIDENQKDITTLILAYEKLYTQNKMNHKLYIIGDGPSKEHLLNFVINKQLDSQIFFLGKKTNPFIWMKNTDMFILSSKFEGFGLVLVEAMIVNTFVLSSNCKVGPNEILYNGGCGDLFEIGNVDELSEKIEYALSDENYRNRKIKKAYERIKEFDKELSIKSLTEILEA